MGKRNKESQAGRRKPMIQLETNNKKNVPSVSRTVFKEQAEPKEMMDNELAGFLAEIKSLAPQEKEQQAASDERYDPNTFDPSSQGHLLPDPWQACYDESSTYYYYWNKETNEVQWYPPVVNLPLPLPPPPPPPKAEVREEAEEEEAEEAEETKEANESEEDQQEDDEDSENNNEESLMDELTNAAASLASYPDSSSDEDGIDKDKELLNKIKLRIQRKNEKKLQKEIEEKRELEAKLEAKSKEILRLKEANAKDNSIKPSPKRKSEELKGEKQIRETINKEHEENERKRKEKEEMLREKLIQKKKDREKMEIENGKQRDLFSVDIFAEGNNVAKENVISEENESTEQSHIEQHDSNSEEAEEKESTVAEPTKFDTDVDGAETVHATAGTPKDAKNGWRLIDAVYDDEEMSESEESEKSEMDTYADMLLEGGIKEEPTPPIESFPPNTAPPPPPDEVKPPLPPGDEPRQDVKTEDKTLSPEQQKTVNKINAISAQLFQKFQFLGISASEIQEFQLYFVELEVRMRDWQAGSLDADYFLENLEKLENELKKNETNSTPTGWICHWSSEYNMYYYYCNATGQSQWEYPNTTEPIQPAYPLMSYTVPSTATTTTPTSSQQPIVITPLSKKAAALVSPAHGFSREPLPKTKKRAAPMEDSPFKSTEDPYRDPYRYSKKKKDLEDSDPTEATDSGTNSPVPAERKAEDGLDSPQTSNNQENGGIAFKLKAKKTKVKKVESSGLPSKKLKQVSSLVHKWKAVKQQREDEENIELEESDGEDFETASQRRIEEWKQNLETSGKKEQNPNFTEIKGDWRDRLNRKKST